MSTAIITSDTSISHETGLGHPEKPDRVTAIIKNLKKNKNLIWKKNKKFDRKILDFTHTLEYVEQVEKSFPKKGLAFLDEDTIISPSTISFNGIIVFVPTSIFFELSSRASKIIAFPFGLFLYCQSK